MFIKSQKWHFFPREVSLWLWAKNVQRGKNIDSNSVLVKKYAVGNGLPEADSVSHYKRPVKPS